MEINLSNLVRSGVILVVGLPLMLPLGVALTRATDKAEPSKAELAVSKFKDDLTYPCLKWVFSKSDTKSEREAKNAIDEVVGGTANYSGVCQFVL